MPELPTPAPKAKTADKIPARDTGLENLLRPSTLKEFVGQAKLKENLSIYIEASRRRGEALDHCLFYAPPGLGKTTLAHILAREMGANIRVTSGPILSRLGDLAGILTSLEERDVLFIDEIHRMPRLVEEALYPVMEDFAFYIHTGGARPGMGAAHLKLAIPKFTLVAATTRAGLLTGPLRDRFGIIGHLNFYEPAEMKAIVLRSAKILQMAVEEPAADGLARRCRATPRVANRILRRIRDYASVLNGGRVDIKLVLEALERMEIDALGLEPMDRRFLKLIIENFGGGPVGIETLSAALQEEPDTLTDLYEPYLIQCGLLARTSKGRAVTDRAYDHLGLKRPGRGTLSLPLPLESAS